MQGKCLVIGVKSTQVTFIALIGSVNSCYLNRSLTHLSSNAVLVFHQGLASHIKVVWTYLGVDAQYLSCYEYSLDLSGWVFKCKVG